MVMYGDVISSVTEYADFISLCQMERDRRKVPDDEPLSDDWGNIADDLTAEMTSGQMFKIVASDERCQMFSLSQVREHIASESARNAIMSLSLWGMTEACVRAAARRDLHKIDEERVRREEKNRI